MTLIPEITTSSILPESKFKTTAKDRSSGEERSRLSPRGDARAGWESGPAGVLRRGQVPRRTELSPERSGSLPRGPWIWANPDHARGGGICKGDREPKKSCSYDGSQTAGLGELRLPTSRSGAQPLEHPGPGRRRRCRKWAHLSNGTDGRQSRAALEGLRTKPVRTHRHGVERGTDRECGAAAPFPLPHANRQAGGLGGSGLGGWGS